MNLDTNLNEIPQGEDKDFYGELQEVLKRVEGTISDKDLQKMEVSRSTLWRWSNKANKRLPNPNKVLSLLFFDSGLSRVDLVIEHYKGELGKFLKRAFASPINDKEFLADDSFIRDKFDLYIYFICATDRGASKDELQKTIGSVIAKNSIIPSEAINAELIESLADIVGERITRFIDFGMIKEDEKGFLHRTKKSININTERIQKLIQEINKDFSNPEDFATGQGAQYTLQQSLRLEDVLLLNQMIRDDMKKYYDFMHSRANDSSQSIPFAVGIMGTKLLIDPPTKEDSEVLQ